MRATDIIRHRRERTRRANRPVRKLARGAGFIVPLAFLALMSIPAAGFLVGVMGWLALTHDLPDVGLLAQLPARFQPSTATTRLYAWDEPGPEGLRQPLLIDEIADPRAGGRGWTAIETLPAHVVAAHLAAAESSSTPAESPPFTSELASWWRTGDLPVGRSAITNWLVHIHLRQGEVAQPGDWRRALQDWLLARQIGERYTRDQQLEWVLNTAYYGHLAYGIEAAARVYLGKSAAELTAGEAALLATVSQNPAANPFDDLETTRRNQAEILATMAANGTLTPAGAEAAWITPPQLAPAPGSLSLAPDFARLARRELEIIFGPERLLSGGLQVETTLDVALQHQVICLLDARAGEPAGSGGGPPCPVLGMMPAGAGQAGELAVVVLHPATGEVMALAGATTTTRPLGSLVQPFIYLAALSQGYSAATLTMDVPSIYLQDGRPYSPRNADGRFLGPLRLREALAGGRLAPATEVLSWVGIDRVLATARALGIEPVKDDEPLDLTFAMDGFPASLLDTAGAFAVIGNNGTMIGFGGGQELPRPALVRRVIDAAGIEIYAYQPASRDILSPAMAYLLADMLGGGTDVAGEQRLALAGGDGWAINFTPERLVGVVAAGGGAPETMALTSGRSLLEWSLPDDAASWTRPPGLRAVDVCEISGLLPGRPGGCPLITEWFIPGTEPAETDTMVREIAVNRETGRLATYFTPAHLVESRTYIDYPPAAAAWAEDAGVEPPPTEYDTISRIPTRDGGAELDIEPWSVASGQWSVVGSAGGEDFAYYRLAYFPGLLPDAIQTLVARGETAVESADLGVWDTTLVDDGLYTLLLTVVREDGTFDEVAVPVTVENK